MKANGHFVFEEIGEFVNALDIYHTKVSQVKIHKRDLT